MLYTIVANVTKNSPQGHCTHQAPTFFLASSIQGIVNEEHAKKIACGVLNPTNDPTIELHIAAATANVPNRGRVWLMKFRGKTSVFSNFQKAEEAVQKLSPAPLTLTWFTNDVILSRITLNGEHHLIVLEEVYVDE